MKYSVLICMSFVLCMFLCSCQSIPIKAEAACLSGKEIGVANFSPDGNELVFSIGDKQNSSIYSVRIDGTNLVALTTGTTYDFDPVFSSDGRKILFSSVTLSSELNRQQGNICLMNADGSEKLLLTTGPGHDYNPIFSPDGEKVFFLRSNRFGNYSPVALPAWHEIDIYSIKIAGASMNRITTDKSYRMGSLSISSDGNTLMAIITPAKSPYSVWMIPINNPTDKIPVRPDLDEYKTIVPLLHMKAIDYDRLFNPQFSQDGTSMLFTWEGHYKKEYSELYIMDLKTNKAKQITDMKQYVYSPRFSPDGSRITFSTVSHVQDGPFNSRNVPTLWTINKDGTGLNVIKLHLCQQ